MQLKANLLIQLQTEMTTRTQSQTRISVHVRVCVCSVTLSELTFKDELGKVFFNCLPNSTLSKY